MIELRRGGTSPIVFPLVFLLHLPSGDDQTKARGMLPIVFPLFLPSGDDRTKAMGDVPYRVPSVLAFRR